ncbi:MAG: hypothetical protein JXL67_13450, partial [Calditrichaeota bacterium]|nr:hypothetical protein [Calditrichota bacterium]
MMYPAISQEQPVLPPDSSVFTDTSDTLAVSEEEKKADIEGPVKYWADQIAFSVDKKKTYLTGNVRIEYLNMQLNAGKVVIDWDKNLMQATGIVDSTDSLGNPVYREQPVFEELGNEPIYGEKLEYNFRTQRGKVFEGRTSMPPGYYRGESIKKIGKQTLLVKD